MNRPKKLFVKTFGCQMNVYDSERMTELLGADGFAETATMEDADVVLLNTCHIREKAAEKVYSDLGRIRQVKEARGSAGQETIIAVAGCVAQAEGAEILRRAPVVDLVVGPQSYHRLGDLVARAGAEGRGIVETGFPEEDKFAALPRRAPDQGRDGVPDRAGGLRQVLHLLRRALHARRRVLAPRRRRGSRSAPPRRPRRARDHAARPERQRLSRAGTRWPPLVAGRLIARLAAIDGIERIRYTTSHPRDMGDDLIAAHRDEPKLMPYLHLPFQAGSDRILAAMNRKHTAADYLQLLARVRAARPDIALSTDIIVGFPGETEADFDATLEVVEHVGFAQAYSFKYSPRPGTPGAAMADQVPEGVKLERLHRLQELLDRQQTRFNSACVGKVVPVLFEREGRRPGQLVGRSPYLQPVHAMADSSLLGRIVEVAIADARPNSLSGVLKSAEPMTA